MGHLPGFVAVMVFIGVTSSQNVEPSFYYPAEHRSLAGFGSIRPHAQPLPVRPIEELPPRSLYTYQIVPRDEYAITLDPSTETFVWDYIPSPIAALAFVGTTALAIGKWVVIKVPIILLGVALVVGFCAFTPYCTLTISKPFVEKCSRALKTVPYLDEIEEYVSDAVNNFQRLNEVKKK